MSEMAYAMQVLGNLPKNVLTKNPAGSYSFVGRVDGRLSFVRKDGQPVTDEDIHNARSFGPWAAGLGSRVWPTPEAAIETAAALGITVTWKGV